MHTYLGQVYEKAGMCVPNYATRSEQLFMVRTTDDAITICYRGK